MSGTEWMKNAELLTLGRELKDVRIVICRPLKSLVVIESLVQDVDKVGATSVVSCAVLLMLHTLTLGLKVTMNLKLKKKKKTIENHSFNFLYKKKYCINTKILLQEKIVPVNHSNI